MLLCDVLPPAALETATPSTFPTPAPMLPQTLTPCASVPSLLDLLPFLQQHEQPRLQPRPQLCRRQPRRPPRTVRHIPARVRPGFKFCGLLRHAYAMSMPPGCTAVHGPNIILYYIITLGVMGTRERAHTDLNVLDIQETHVHVVYFTASYMHT